MIISTETKPLRYKREAIEIEDLIDFAPDEPEPRPDAMLQNRIIYRQILTALDRRLTNFERDPEVFADSNAILCYDRSDLNVRILPDFFAAFGVDARAILDRELYLPWEVGKPPDFALEVASKNTARHDVEEKIDIYRRIGVPELWYHDRTGGDMYGQPLAGWRLSDGEYLPIALTVEPDGVISGYSPTIRLYLCWDDGQLRFRDPLTDEYLSPIEGVHDALDSEQIQHNAEREAHAETRQRLERERIAHAGTRQALERERRARESERERTRRLEEELRRLRGAE